MLFDRDKAQFGEDVLGRAEDVAEIVELARNFKGPNGKIDPSDFLAVPEAIPKVVRLVEYLSEGDPNDPADDAFVASRGISLFTAYGRGSGAFEKIRTGGSAPEPE